MTLLVQLQPTRHAISAHHHASKVSLLFIKSLFSILNSRRQSLQGLEWLQLNPSLGKLSKPSGTNQSSKLSNISSRFVAFRRVPTCHEAQGEAQLLLCQRVGGERRPGGPHGGAAHVEPPARTVKRKHGHFTGGTNVWLAHRKRQERREDVVNMTKTRLLHGSHEFFFFRITQRMAFKTCQSVKVWIICVNSRARIGLGFTFDSGIQSPLRRGWSLKWRCCRWVLESTSEKRSRWGLRQSSEENTKAVTATSITPEWTAREAGSHTPSMCCRSSGAPSGTAGRGQPCRVQRSLLRSDHSDGSTDRCLRTKRKRSGLNEAHYLRPFLFLLRSITLAASGGSATGQIKRPLNASL